MAGKTVIGYRLSKGLECMSCCLRVIVHGCSIEDENYNPNTTSKPTITLSITYNLYPITYYEL